MKNLAEEHIIEVNLKNLETETANKETRQFYNHIIKTPLQVSDISRDSICRISNQFVSNFNGMVSFDSKEDAAKEYILNLYNRLIAVAVKNNRMIEISNQEIAKHNQENPKNPKLFYAYMRAITVEQLINAYDVSDQIFKDHCKKYQGKRGFELLDQFQFNIFFEDFIGAGFHLREPAVKPGDAFVWNDDMELRFRDFGSRMESHLNQLGPQFSHKLQKYIFWTGDGRQVADECADSVQNTVWANFIFKINQSILPENSSADNGLGQYNDYYLSYCYLSSRYAEEAGRAYVRSRVKGEAPKPIIYIQHENIIGADSIFWNFELKKLQESIVEELRKTIENSDEWYLSPDMQAKNIIQVYALKKAKKNELEANNVGLKILKGLLNSAIPCDLPGIKSEILDLESQNRGIVNLGNRENWIITPLRDIKIVHYSGKSSNKSGLGIAPHVVGEKYHGVSKVPVERLVSITKQWQKFTEKAKDKKESIHAPPHHPVLKPKGSGDRAGKNK